MRVPVGESELYSFTLTPGKTLDSHWKGTVTGKGQSLERDSHWKGTVTGKGPVTGKGQAFFCRNKTVDRIRSAGACIIAGIQSEISADPAISEKKRKVLSLNMRSRLIFRAADMEGATLSADFIGKKRISKKTISSKTGSLTRTISRRQEQEHYVHPTQLARAPTFRQRRGLYYVITRE